MGGVVFRQEIPAGKVGPVPNYTAPRQNLPPSSHTFICSAEEPIQTQRRVRTSARPDPKAHMFSDGTTWFGPEHQQNLGYHEKN